MTIRGSVVVLVLPFAAACTSTKAIGPEPDEPRPVTAPPTAPTVDKPPDDKAPEDDPRIGQPCGPGDTRVCGTKGRVAMGVVQSTHPLKRLAPPCELPAPEERLPVDFGDHARACIHDDRVYIVGSCLECRIYSQWMMVARVAEMTDAQLADAQRRMKMPAEPLLRSTTAWRTALADRKR